jgi:hypothetical protein
MATPLDASASRPIALTNRIARNLVRYALIQRPSTAARALPGRRACDVMPLVVIGIMAILSAFMMEQNCPEREDDELPATLTRTL